MKKATIFVASLCIMATTSFGLISCSDVDNGENSKLEQIVNLISGKYNINNTTSEYEYIELFENDTYLIKMREVNKRNNPNITRILNDGIHIYGTYSKVSDNIYLLEGVGLMKVNRLGSKVQSFVITKEDGRETSLSVTKEQTYPNSNRTSKLCREWKVKMIEQTRIDKGNLVYSIKWPVGSNAANTNFNSTTNEPTLQDLIDEFTEEGPNMVIFSPSGTYTTLFNDNSISSAIWYWKDETKGELYYYKNDSNNEDVGIYYMTVCINEKQLIMEGKKFLFHIIVDSNSNNPNTSSNEKIDTIVVQTKLMLETIY